MSDIDLTRRVPATTLRALKRFSLYFDTRIEGLENIPDGGVLVVGNHALAGIDSLALMPALYEGTKRVPRGLGLKALFDVPLLKDALHQCGAVAGDRENAVELLLKEEMVVVYPGGARDSLKNRNERYRLKWGKRCGFARVAIAAQRPIVPIAGIGPDEVFPILLDNGLRVPWLNNERLPVFLPLLRRVPFRFYVGRPLYPPEDQSEESAEIFAAEVSNALEMLIVNGLERRL